MQRFFRSHARGTGCFHGFGAFDSLYIQYSLGDDHGGFLFVIKKRSFKRRYIWSTVVSNLMHIMNFTPFHVSNAVLSTIILNKKNISCYHSVSAA